MSRFVCCGRCGLARQSRSYSTSSSTLWYTTTSRPSLIITAKHSDVKLTYLTTYLNSCPSRVIRSQNVGYRPERESCNLYRLTEHSPYNRIWTFGKSAEPAEKDIRSKTRVKTWNNTRIGAHPYRHCRKRKSRQTSQRWHRKTESWNW